MVETMKVVAIAPRTLLWVVAGVIGLWFVGRASDLLVMAFLAIVIAAAVRPAVIWAEIRLPWLPRQLTPILVFILLFGLIALVLLLLAPVISAQAAAFAASLPAIGARFQQWWSVLTGWLALFGVRVQVARMGTYLSKGGTAWLGSTAAIAAAVAASVSTTVFVFIGSFFILIDELRLAKGLVRLTPPAWRPWVEAQFEPIAARLGGYVRGLLFNIASLATLLASGYSLGHVPFGLVLGVMTGIFAVIPFGELVGFAIALLVAFASEPTVWSAARVGICFGIAEVLQQNLIGPVVMARAIALPPVVLIFALLVGDRLLGIEGMVVAVPFAATVAVLVDSLWIPAIEGAVIPAAAADESP